MLWHLSPGLVAIASIFPDVIQLYSALAEVQLYHVGEDRCYGSEARRKAVPKPAQPKSGAVLRVAMLWNLTLRLSI